MLPLALEYITATQWCTAEGQPLPWRVGHLTMSGDMWWVGLGVLPASLGWRPGMLPNFYHVKFSPIMNPPAPNIYPTPK